MVASQRLTLTTRTPLVLAMYCRMDTNSAKPRSETLRPHRRYMPSRLRSSIQMTANSSVSRCASLKNQSRLRLHTFSYTRSRFRRTRSQWLLPFWHRESFRCAARSSDSAALYHCGDSMSIVQRQEMLESEIHAGSFTCSCRDFREFLARDDEYKVFSQSGTFDGDSTDLAGHFAGLVVTKYAAHDRNFIVIVMEFVSRLL